jgi:hypothetical protein
MPIENDSNYTVGKDKKAIDEELAMHSTSGTEWGEIADYEAGVEPRNFKVKNWRGDILNSLKQMEEEFPPGDYVLIQREFVERDYAYSVQPYPRRKPE